MIFSYLTYGIKVFSRWLSNLIRKTRRVPDYVVFILEGDYPQVPQVGGNPLFRMFRPSKTSLMELDDQITTVADDPRVEGVVFLLRPLDIPLAKVDVLRDMFRKLQDAGKTVSTWSFSYDTTQYYLASAADTVILQKGGTLAPMGLYRQYIYLGDLFDQVGLKADFMQTSPYKSMGDTFSRSKMSAEVKEMGNWLADATYTEIVSKVAEGRKIDVEAAAYLIDQTPCIDLKALEIDAVDALLGEDDLPEFLGKDGKPAWMLPWKDAQKRLFRAHVKKPGNYIALFQVEGLIVDGRSSLPPLEPPIPIPIVMDERAGDISIVNAIRRIMADPRAKGVVLYVNSRGGSATASESIRNALDKLAAEKSLVVVMGPVAASGGYWVSTPGKMILAEPNTLTGSIGVLMGKFADKGFLNKLFIHMETISRGENIGIYTPSSPFNEEERQKIGQYLERVYELFLERVSDCRDLKLEEVDAIGGGRVWTGRQALEHGLVDELGGMNLGLRRIRELTGLNERSSVRIFGQERNYVSPVSQPSGIFRYGWMNLKTLNAKAACLCPWFEDYS